MAERNKSGTPQLAESPINLRKAESIPEFSGFLIIRLKPGVVSAMRPTSINLRRNSR